MKAKEKISKDKKVVKDTIKKAKTEKDYEHMLIEYLEKELTNG